VLRGSAGVRDATRLDAWVAQVTVNTVNSVLRQRKWRRHLPLEALPEQQLPVLSINHDTRELASRLASLLHRLPAPDRCLLLSYWLSPATVGTLAADAGCSTGTVQRRLRRAQARFDRLVQHDRPILTCLGVEGGGALTSAANDDAPRPKLAIARGALSAVRRRRPALRAVT
jgi:DNA-directed RNA polymerase specialized sigma24 family protein